MTHAPPPAAWTDASSDELLHTMNRRRFLGLAASAAAAGVLLPLGLTSESGAAAPGLSKLNRSRAATWALNNWDSPEEIPGGDCINFCSKALLAGGAQPTASWTMGQPAWNRVDDFVQAFCTQGYATFHSLNLSTSLISQASLADIIVYRWANQTRLRNRYWDHAAIVTSQGSNGRGSTIITQHTVAQRYRVWNQTAGTKIEAASLVRLMT